MALGDLVVNLLARTDRFTKPLNAARGSISRFVSGAVTGFGRVGLAAEGVRTAFDAIESLTLPLQLAARAEQTAVALETLLGSASVAQSLIKELRGFGASTPFGEDEIFGAARSLIAFGTGAGKVSDELRMIGDISSGLAIPLGELAEIYGKARVQGRLFGEDINQLTGRGIPVIGELAKILGVAESEVKGMVAAGHVGFPELQQAFRNLTSEGGRFFGMTQRQSETLMGKWSTLTDNLTNSFMELGVAIDEEFDIKGLVGDATELIEKFKTEWRDDVVEGVREAALAGKDLALFFKDVAVFSKQVADNVNEFDSALGDINKATGGKTPKNLFETLAPGLSFILDQMKDKPAPDADINQVLKEADKRLKEFDETFGTDKPAAKASAQADQMTALEADIAKWRREREEATMQAGKDMLTSFGHRFRDVWDTFTPIEQRDEQNRNVRSLEVGTQEAFEVLQANTRPRDKDQTSKKQLDELKNIGTKLESLIAEARRDARSSVDIRSF